MSHERARCPACEKDCAVCPDGHLWLHYDSRVSQGYRNRLNGYCVGRDVWAMTSDPTIHWTPKQQRQGLVPLIALAVYAKAPDMRPEKSG
jgi:hypothetical protein